MEFSIGGEALEEAEDIEGEPIVVAAPVDAKVKELRDLPLTEFEADSFSVYALVVTQVIEKLYIDAEGATWRITVGYGADAGISANAELVVTEVADESYLAETKQLIPLYQRVEQARFFDIVIVDGGVAVQPAVPVNVCVTLEDAPEGQPAAVHFGEAGGELLSAVQGEDGVTFDAASLSVYGVVYTVDFEYESFSWSIQNAIAGDDALPFTFEIALSRTEGTLDYNDADVKIQYRKGDSGTARNLTFASNKTTVTVKQNTPVTITGIPIGTTYTLTEATQTNFEAIASQSGTITIVTGTASEIETVAAAQQKTITAKGQTQSTTFANARKTGVLEIAKVLNEQYPIAAEAAEAYNVVVELKTKQGSPQQAVRNIAATLTWKTGSTTNQTENRTFANGAETLLIKGGQTVTIEGLPTDVTYAVTEPDTDTVKYGDRFTTTFTNASGDIQATPAKSEAEVVNTREYYDLTVEKRVSGNMADANRSFKFILVSVSPNTDSGAYTLTQSGQADRTIAPGDSDNNAFYLKHGESATITGIPANAVVQVMEETGAYTAAWSGTNGVNPSAPTVVTEGTRSSSVTLTMSDSAKLTATNSLTAPVETGIKLDVAPYVTLLLLLGAAAWLARRRRT